MGQHMRINKFLFITLFILIGMLLAFSSRAYADGEKYIRWSKSKMPLKVYIERNPNVPGYQSSYAVDVAKAFAGWKTNTNNFVDFYIINDKKAADIIVRWEDRIQKNDYAATSRGHSYVWGITKVGNPTEIILVTKHPLQNDQPLSNNTIYMIALHEIGHALGMWWHSRDENDIMYPDFIVASSALKGSRIVVNKNRGSLSSRDVANLKALYSNNKVTCLDQLARNSKMSLPLLNNAVAGNIETTGVAAATAKGTSIEASADLGKAMAILRQDPYNAEAHNNIGLVYMDSNNYAKAIQSFKNSLNLDPYSYKAHFNLGIAYSKVGSNDLAVKEFLQYLKLNPEAPNAPIVLKEIQRLKTM